MSSKHIRADINIAWPSAELAVIGPKAAVEIIFKKEIAAAEDPDKALREKLDEFIDEFANPYKAAERGYINDVIEPKFTRPNSIQALQMLETKTDTNSRKKHGNIPL